MERLCINCKHFLREGRREPDKCIALRGKANPVYGGDVDYIDPGQMRLTVCGWNDPKLWEPVRK